MLILSGGEPLMRKDIYDLAAYASGKGMMVVLGSNGILLNDRIARKLKEKGITGVSISLDSLNPGIHDRIRSCSGAWDSAVKAIRICRDHGLSVQINTVVTQENHEELPELADYAKAIGAKVFSPFFLVCTGRGEKLTDITPEQYENILSFIEASQDKYNGMMIRPRCAPTFRRILYQNKPGSPLLKLDTGRCMAGTSYCRITPGGEVTPCPYMPLSAGNVREENFQDLWENSTVLKPLRYSSLKGKCGYCEFRLLCGGCRARAFASCNDSMGEDPWCSYTPKGGDVIRPPLFSTGEHGETILDRRCRRTSQKSSFFRSLHGKKCSREIRH
jgi:radical SAM protein with 4Fe4S-binding SPASM domain